MQALRGVPVRVVGRLERGDDLRDDLGLRGVARFILRTQGICMVFEVRRRDDVAICLSDGPSAGCSSVISQNSEDSDSEVSDEIRYVRAAIRGVPRSEFRTRIGACQRFRPVTLPPHTFPARHSFGFKLHTSMTECIYSSYNC